MPNMPSDYLLNIWEEILAIKKLNDVSMTPCHHYQVKLEYKVEALYRERRMNEWKYLGCENLFSFILRSLYKASTLYSNLT